MHGSRQDYVCSADRRHTDEYDAAVNRLYADFHAAHPGIGPDDPAWETFRASDTLGNRVAHLGYERWGGAIYGCPKCAAPMHWLVVVA